MFGPPGQLADLLILEDCAKLYALLGKWLSGNNACVCYFLTGDNACGEPCVKVAGRVEFSTFSFDGIELCHKSFCNVAWYYNEYQRFCDQINFDQNTCNARLKPKVKCKLLYHRRLHTNLHLHQIHLNYELSYFLDVSSKHAWAWTKTEGPINHLWHTSVGKFVAFDDAECKQWHTGRYRSGGKLRSLNCYLFSLLEATISCLLEETYRLT